MSNKDLDVNYLLKSMDNNNNENIMKYSYESISTGKNNILQQLQLSREHLKDLHKKLKQYRYVDDLSDINYGSYIRWIPLKNPNIIKLTNGGHICDIKFYNDNVQILCKNSMHRIFQIKFDEQLIFQKLTNQERVILDVIKYLNT